MKILVIAPHPDDEVIGCGGTIKKYSKKGAEVYLCVVTKAYAPDWPEKFLQDRPKEIEKASEILGIKKTFFLDHPTVKLDVIGQKQINESITKIVDEVNPDVVYIPTRSDLNKDHRLVFDAAMVACRHRADSNIKKILCYETSSEVERGGFFGQFFLNVYEDITGEFDAKIEAIKVYQSELKEFPHPRSLKGITVLAEKRGSESGFLKAEAFMLVRERI